MSMLLIGAFNSPASASPVTTDLAAQPAQGPHTAQLHTAVIASFKCGYTSKNKKSRLYICKRQVNATYCGGTRPTMFSQVTRMNLHLASYVPNETSINYAYKTFKPTKRAVKRTLRVPGTVTSILEAKTPSKPAKKPTIACGAP